MEREIHRIDPPHVDRHMLAAKEMAHALHKSPRLVQNWLGDLRGFGRDTVRGLLCGDEDALQKVASFRRAGVFEDISKRLEKLRQSNADYRRSAVPLQVALDEDRKYYEERQE